MLFVLRIQNMLIINLTIFQYKKNDTFTISPLQKRSTRAEQPRNSKTCHFCMYSNSFEEELQCILVYARSSIFKLP